MKHLAALVGQPLDGRVEFLPAVERLGGIGRAVDVPRRVVSILAVANHVRPVIGGIRGGAGVLSREIDQLAMQLRRRQRHDRPRRGGVELAERAVQPQRRVLKDVVGVVPAADVRKPAEHPVGQAAQAAGAELDDPVAGGEVAGGQPGQTCGQFLFARVFRLHRHRPLRFELSHESTGCPSAVRSVDSPPWRMTSTMTT